MPEQTTLPRTPRKIAYPKGGAKGTVIPPNDDAFEMFTSRTGCTELLSKIQEWEPSDDLPQRTIYLYRAAANACLSHWDAAVADFDKLAPLVGQFAAAAADDPLPCPDDATSGQTTCARCEQVVMAWLTEVVAAYRSDPDLPPVLTGTAAAVPC